MAYLLRFDDRYIVSFREQGEDLSMPNRGLGFATGGVATLLWNHDLSCKVYYLTFLKKNFSEAQVINHFQEYKFQLMPAKVLHEGRLDIIGNGKMSSKFIVAQVAKTKFREPPYRGDSDDSFMKNMTVLNPEGEDAEYLDYWDQFKRPILLSMHEYIKKRVKMAFQGVPDVVLGNPKETLNITKPLTVNDRSKNTLELKEKKGIIVYELAYEAANIEALMTPDCIWDMIWEAYITAIINTQRHSILTVHDKFQLGNMDIKKAMGVLGFDYFEIAKIGTELYDSDIFQMTAQGQAKVKRILK